MSANQKEDISMHAMKAGSEFIEALNHLSNRITGIGNTDLARGNATRALLSVLREKVRGAIDTAQKKMDNDALETAMLNLTLIVDIKLGIVPPDREIIHRLRMGLCAEVPLTTADIDELITALAA